MMDQLTNRTMPPREIAALAGIDSQLLRTYRDDLAASDIGIQPEDMKHHRYSVADAVCLHIARLLVDTAGYKWPVALRLGGTMGQAMFKPRQKIRFYAGSPDRRGLEHAETAAEAIQLATRQGPEPMLVLFDLDAFRASLPDRLAAEVKRVENEAPAGHEGQ